MEIGRRTMRSAIVLSSVALAIALAACGRPEPSQKESADLLPPPPPADQAAESPSIAISSAPGVAFNYGYAFRVPNAKISAVQEEHAQSCEKLGLDRCRITGMRYRLLGDNEVSAMLAFKLAPELARAFGKEGIAAVGKAEGMLVDSEISGIDAGATIDGTNRQVTALREELAKIEEQLKGGGLPASERAELQAQASALREQLRAASATRQDARASLATTPMVFEYGSGDFIPGFDGTSPLREALRTASDSFLTMLGFLIVATATLLPWAAIAALGWWLWRRLRKPLALSVAATEQP
ncbi:MAG: hypothetical protein ACKVOP_04465 [Sphingomonadaceae bacterium]